jgi:hypothetical protein
MLSEVLSVNMWSESQLQQFYATMTSVHIVATIGSNYDLGYIDALNCCNQEAWGTYPSPVAKAREWRPVGQSLWENKHWDHGPSEDAWWGNAWVVNPQACQVLFWGGLWGEARRFSDVVQHRRLPSLQVGQTHGGLSRWWPWWKPCGAYARHCISKTRVG